MGLHRATAVQSFVREGPCLLGIFPPWRTGREYLVRCNWRRERHWNLTFSIDMWIACLYVLHMSAMIQIRNVPDTLHRRLKSRAALAGMSLSDYLLSEIRELAARPTLEELRSRLERRSSVMPSIAPVEAVRAERDRQ
jgi:antitoxin FitA